MFANTAVITTRLIDLVRAAAFRLDDMVEVVAQQAGTTTTLTDWINIPTGNEDLKRRQIVFLTGSNLGESRIITAMDHDAHTITWDPALGVAVSGSDEAMILNKRGMGFKLAEYVRAAKMAQADGGMWHKVMYESTPAAFSSETGYINIPDGMEEVAGVSWLDDENNWHDILPAQYDGHSGWFARSHDARVAINGRMRYEIDGRTTRLIGLGREGELNEWEDETSIPAVWMVPQMCFHLSVIGLNREGTSNNYRAKTILTYQQEAESRLATIRTRRGPMAVRSRG